VTMNLGLRLALEAEGLSADDVAAVDKAIPAVERIVTVVQQVAPAIEKEYPDFMSVLPILQRLLQIAKG
jgi:hypothetical protein